MLAVSRTHRVIGRMILLVSSISTIKFIRARGVPWGRRCESMCLVFLVHPYLVTVSHKIMDVGRVKDRCAVIENSWG
jgi:hypothetical protein